MAATSVNAAPRALTVKQVAERLGLGKATVNRIIYAGDLKAFYPTGRGHGRPVRITEAALAKFIESTAA